MRSITVKVRRIDLRFYPTLICAIFSLSRLGWDAYFPKSVLTTRKEMILGLIDRLMGRKRRDKRVNARLRVTVSKDDAAYWTEDIAVGGFRMNIGKRLAIGDLTGGSRDVPLEIELDAGPVVVYGEPIWTVRMDDGQLSTGWMLTRYDGDARKRLTEFVERAE